MRYKLLYTLTGVTALVFVLFWTVGFDRPDDEVPDRNAPLLTDVLLWVAYLYTAGCIGVAAWSAWHSARTAKSESVVNGVPVKRITIGVAAGTVALLILTFLLSSSQPLVINGQPYAETFWLKTSGMFVTSSILLIAIAVLSMGISRITRMRRNRKEAR